MRVVVQKIAAAAGAKPPDEVKAAVAAASGAGTLFDAVDLCTAVVAGCQPLSALSSDVMALFEGLAFGLGG